VAVIAEPQGVSSPSGRVHSATAYLGDTVVRADMALTFDDAGKATDSPYNSADAIAFILRSLRELR
jgi:hypothetical protein